MVMFDYLSLNLAMAIEMTHIFFLKSGVVPWGCSYYTATEDGNPVRWQFTGLFFLQDIMQHSDQ